MARISAITNDGKEQSKAEGNLKSVLKMASLIAGNNHQIIINKNELDGFVTESKLEICTLLPQEIIEDMSFHGTINCACGTYGNIHMHISQYQDTFHRPTRYTPVKTATLFC